MTAITADVADGPSRATSINKIDILSEDAALSTTNATCDDGTKHASSFESNTKSPLQLSKLHYCDVLMKITDEEVKSIHCLEDSSAEISIIQKDLIKGVYAPVLGTVTVKRVIGQPTKATLVTLKIKPATSGNHENIAPYIDVVFAACDITSDLQAILCDADLKSLKDMTAYDVLKPSVGSKLDTGVTECVIIDECDVLYDISVMTQAADDVTLINNAEIMHAEISSNDNENQTGSAVSSIDHLSNVVPTLITNKCVVV